MVTPVNEERTDLVVLKSLRYELRKLVFLLCFAHPARIRNPKMCFLLLSPPWFIQSKEVLRFQIPSLLPALLFLFLLFFYKPITSA